MTEPAARPIGFGALFAEQLRWYWKRLWLSIVLVTGLTAVVVAWMIASMPMDQRHMAFLLVGNAFHPLLVLIAISWSLSAWRDDPPKDRQYFWLQPVNRTTHTIARSLAGGVWLLASVAVIIGVVFVTTALTQGADAVYGSARFWLYVAGAIALAYLASSIPAMLSNKPALWIVGAVAIVVIANIIATIRELDWLKSAASVFQGGRYSFGAALGAPGVEAARAVLPDLMAARATEAPQMARIAEAEPTAALLIWLPIAIVGYLAAAVLARPR